MTNLLQAGQLSQGGLTRRLGKADTLGERWQVSAQAAVGSQASGLLSPGAEQTGVRQPWVWVLVLPLTGLVTWATCCACPGLTRLCWGSSVTVNEST